MPYINVNDAYILDNTGKQVDDAVDYALANSNRNLFDNPWFTVNQRGKTSYNAGYSVDRWVVTRNASINVLSNGIRLTTTANRWGIEQRCVKNLIPHGTTVTFSALIDGKIVQKSFVWNGASTTVYPDGSAVGLEINTAPTEYDRWYICNTIASTHTIRAVKIEIGSYSTLANDVPPKKRSALADCQERFLRVKSDTYVGVVGFGSQTQSDRAYILIPTPVTMELNENNTMSVSLTGTARLIGNGSGTINVTSVSFVSREANGVLIACFGSNIAANQTYNLYLTSGSYIDISGDLL